MIPDIGIVIVCYVIVRMVAQFGKANALAQALGVGVIIVALLVGADLIHLGTKGASLLPTLSQ